MLGVRLGLSIHWTVRLRVNNYTYLEEALEGPYMNKKTTF